MDILLQDLRYAVRTLRKSPGFSVTAILILGLGIGASAALFGVVNSVLLAPLPFDRPDRLVAVLSTNVERGGGTFFSSPPDFRELRAQNRSFESVAAWYPAAVNLAGEGSPERVAGASVSPGLFTLLGAEPAIGRSFVEEEGGFGNHRAVLLSHGLWTRRFDARTDVIGKSVVVDGEAFVVTGVMPPGFDFPARETDVWLPMAFAADDPFDSRGNYFLRLVARLKPGVSLAQAGSELQAFAHRIGEHHPESSMTGMRVLPLREQIVGEVRPMLLLFLGAVGLVLLIVCGNVGNLLLARATAREGEIAVRASLGAVRGRLLRQMLTESLLLGLAGGALGVAVASLAVAGLAAFDPLGLPRQDEIRVDGAVLFFSFALACTTTMLFGLVPALRSSKVKARCFLHGGRFSSGPRQQRLRDGLVAAEIALALVLLLGAGLLVRSFVEVLREDPGYRVDNLLTFSIALPSVDYPEAGDVWAFFDRLLERVEALPGVRSATVTSGLSLQGGYWTKLVTPTDRPPPVSMDQVPVVGYRLVSRDYFQTMGVPIHRGKGLEGSDRHEGPGAVVINEAMAQTYWPGEDPVGKHILLGPPEAMLADVLPPGFHFPRLEVVGVSANERFASLDQPSEPELYRLYPQSIDRPPAMFVALRSDRDPLSLAAAVRTVVREMDPDQPLAELATMTQLVRAATAERRFSLYLVAGFAAVAVGLAAIGLYGVIAYRAAQRRREIGIRIALGANPGNVRRLVLRQGFALAAVGIGIGLVAALVVSRVMSSLLYRVSTTDPVTFVGAVLLLAGIALLASYIPARRATTVDPTVALRHE